jgi:hypothetical protein
MRYHTLFALIQAAGAFATLGEWPLPAAAQEQDRPRVIEDKPKPTSQVPP